MDVPNCTCNNYIKYNTVFSGPAWEAVMPAEACINCYEQNLLTAYGFGTKMTTQETEHECKICGCYVKEQIVSSYDSEINCCDDLVWLCYTCDSIEAQEI